MISCENCGTEVPDDITFDVTELGHDEELIEKHWNDPGELGTVTLYYCDTNCFMEAHE